MADLGQSSAGLTKVRYGTFSGDSGWIVCRAADVRAEVLVIEFDMQRRNYVPLHVVRGPIEVRPFGDETTNGPASEHYPILGEGSVGRSESGGGGRG